MFSRIHLLTDSNVLSDYFFAKSSIESSNTNHRVVSIIQYRYAKALWKEIVKRNLVQTWNEGKIHEYS